MPEYRFGFLKISYERIEEMVNLSKDIKIVDVVSQYPQQSSNHILIKLMGTNDNLYKKFEGLAITIHPEGDLKEP